MSSDVSLRVAHTDGIPHVTEICNGAGVAILTERQMLLPLSEPSQSSPVSGSPVGGGGAADGAVTWAAKLGVHVNTMLPPDTTDAEAHASELQPAARTGCRSDTAAVSYS
ncbi:hypothetical protein CYMTET_13515 [Cymbomonas tetramitiformis]|uniref:Uncharacterized protein n=1 Tax=Cymbomonas tetramitiformis TaxID=36881 RepID=A0AAE0GIA4_9CHLO|nr:hypothetical protein CYMTET_55949 [Cymbomonas tetramitiformis]KAK3278559.1 hypothetical protein CYMTET_13515 [Cymbomonas tetramitiformis]